MRRGGDALLSSLKSTMGPTMKMSIDNLAAKLPAFGADDAKALVPSARDRAAAAIARAPEAAEADIALG